MAKKIPDVYAAMRQLDVKIRKKKFRIERSVISESPLIIRRENFRGKYYFVARINGRIDAMRRQARDFRKQDAVSVYKQNKTFYKDRVKDSWKNEHDELVDEFRSSGRDVQRRAYKGRKFGLTVSVMIDGHKVSATSPYRKQSLRNAREQAKINLVPGIMRVFNVNTDRAEELLAKAEEDNLVSESAVWYKRRK